GARQVIEESLELRGEVRPPVIQRFDDLLPDPFVSSKCFPEFPIPRVLAISAAPLTLVRNRAEEAVVESIMAQVGSPTHEPFKVSGSEQRPNPIAGATSLGRGAIQELIQVIGLTLRHTRPWPVDL